MRVTEAPTVIIRDIELISEMREVEALQTDVWGCEERDVVPLTIFATTKEVGAVLIGAYDGPSLAGFVYGFVGYENGHTIHHSHMLAVRPVYRNFNLGYKLKLAQRERVLTQGITRITWTFDPLQSLNAYLNFGKLGVVADTYKINFYGEATSSFLHRIGTDRLWVSWPIDSRRVRERLQTGPKKEEPLFECERIPSLVQVGRNDVPQRNESSEILGREHLFVEIPADINTLQLERPELAVRWREETRWAFSEAMAAGYLIEEFYRSPGRDHPVGIYHLSYRKRVGDFA